MAGNSQRRGARRGSGSKKGAVVGSGGQRRRGLEGRGPTPPAEARKGHPAARRAAAASKNAARKPARARGESPELLVGRNPVVEALRAAIPTTALYVAVGLEPDERVAEAVQRAADRGVPVLEVGRSELDKMTGGILHQGIGLQVPPYRYADLDDVLGRAIQAREPALLVALDGVTDPRNLGAVVRSAAAFGAHGVIVPERRSTPMTATAWRTSAGAAARLPVARVTNLVRSIKDRPAGRPLRGRPGRGRRDRAGRPGCGGGPAAAGRRLGGARAVPAGRGDLRPAGVDPDDRDHRVAQRRHRRGGDAGRGGPPPPPRLTAAASPAAASPAAASRRRLASPAASPRRPPPVPRQPGGAVESRTTSRGRNTLPCRAGVVGLPSMSASSPSTAARAISAIGWASVVSAGVQYAASGMSSNPTTDSPARHGQPRAAAPR